MKALAAADRLDPKCDAATRPVAYAICAQVYSRAGCECRRNGKPPCDCMTLAACAAEKIITEHREATA